MNLKKFSIINTVVLTALILTFFHSGVYSGVRIREKRVTESNANKDKLNSSGVLQLNTKKTFENVEPLDAYVFLVGNDSYSQASDFTQLRQCFNDVKLLQSIFIHCAKVNPKKVFINKDLTLKQFKTRFNQFIKSLNENSLVIVTYSGHGNNDGSLVFVNGGMLRPSELKAMVNSYKNDTVLIIDACYSGNNEGPKEIDKVIKKDEFKSNSIRIYASLAHLTAKEINYSNSYFGFIRPFYRDVLGLSNIKGNGYFTAMIGLFFAEYKFKADENISFKDLVSYVTNKGKQYVEFLALSSLNNNEKRNEAKFRLNQQPKILPIDEMVDFKDINHNFILIQDRIEPLGLELGLMGGMFLAMGNLGKFYTDPGITVTLFANYQIDFLLENLYANCSFNYLNLNSTGQNGKQRTVKLNIITPSVGLRYQALEFWIARLMLGLDFGYALTFAQWSSFGPIKEETVSKRNFYFGANTSLGFEVIRDLEVFGLIDFKLYAYKDEPLYGLAAQVGAGYYF